MVGVEGITDWIGREVVDREGEKVGKLADVYYDTAGAEPAFVAVKSGTFGRSQTVAPLEGATLARDYVRLDTTREVVKSAPSEDAGGRLTGVDALAVLTHFGLPSEPDLEGEERVCFQTAGAAEETERKRAELEAEEARETQAAGSGAGAIAATAGAEAGPAPDRDLVTEDRGSASASVPEPTRPDSDEDDDPLRRLEQLERRVAALEARVG